MTVPERVDAVLEVSLGAMADDPAKRKRCLFLAVLAPGTLARSDMLQDLWGEVRRGGVGSVRAAILYYSHHLFFVEALLHKRVKACIVMAPNFFCGSTVSVLCGPSSLESWSIWTHGYQWNAVLLTPCLRACCSVWMTYFSDTRLCFLYCATSTRLVERPRRSLHNSSISPCSSPQEMLFAFTILS